MATLASANNPTLLDLAKLTDPNGMQATVIRMMDQSNAVLNYFSFMEGNLPTGHRSTVSAGLPEATWRSLYEGVQPTTGSRVQVTDNCGELVAYGMVDKSLVQIAPNPMQFRLEEDMDHIEGMSQELAKAIFYHNEATHPERITGLSPRYNSLSAANKRNLLDGGGRGTDNRSVWLVVSGPTTVTGIVPKGSVAGIQVEDKGVQSVPVSDPVASNIGAPSGKLMEAYVTHYQLQAGISVRDWRYAVRICNLDSSLMAGGPTGASAPDLTSLMFQAIRRIPAMGRGRAAWYMDRDTTTFLEQQLAHKVAQSTLMVREVGGVMIDTFKGIPIAVCDALETDEARVT